MLRIRNCLEESQRSLDSVLLPSSNSHLICYPDLWHSASLLWDTKLLGNRHFLLISAILLDILKHPISPSFYRWNCLQLEGEQANMISNYFYITAEKVFPPKWLVISKWVWHVIHTILPDGCALMDNMLRIRPSVPVLPCPELGVLPLMEPLATCSAQSCLVYLPEQLPTSHRCSRISGSSLLGLPVCCSGLTLGISTLLHSYTHHTKSCPLYREYSFADRETSPRDQSTFFWPPHELYLHNLFKFSQSVPMTKMGPSSHTYY